MSEAQTPSNPIDALAGTLPALASEAASDLVRVQGHRHRGTTGVRWPGRSDLVVTALHGLEREDAVDVTSAAGVTSRADLVGRDPALDLALLRLESDAPPSTRGWRLGDTLRVAEPVLTVARPGESVRAALAVLGVVGGPVRLGHGGSLDRYLELDRDLPRGFSGGLVLDLAGRALGLAMRGVVRGASVVVGTTTLQRVVPLLETHGHLPRGYIGVGVYPARLPAEHALRLQRRGAVVVVALQDNGPALQAGVRIGDIVIAVDDEAVMSPNDLRAALEDRAGRRVTLSVIRGTETVRIDVEATQAA